MVIKYSLLHIKITASVKKAGIKILACAVHTYLFFLYMHCPLLLENKKLL